MSVKGTIFFVAPSAYPIGGVATWLDYLCEGLEARGWEIFVGLAAGKWHDTGEYGRLHCGLNTISISYKTGTREGRIRALMDGIQAVGPKLVVGVNMPDCYLAAARHRGNNRFPKIAMTLHGIQPDFYDDVKVHSGVLDGVVCTNKLACELVNVDAGIDKSRILYAPYGVAVGARVPAAKMHQQPFCLGYVGRLAEDQKLVRDLPNIIKQLEVIGVSVKLLVAGTGPEEQWLKREFAGRIKDLSVEFLGAIKFKDMKDRVYARTDALILTSSWETGPIVIWEAMASGVPVVTSRYLGSGLENSLVNGENCLMFQPGDVTAAAACIKRIIDENLTAKLITGGYQLVARKYSHAISVDAWERCFRQILAAPVKCDANNTLPMVAPSGRLDAVFGTGLGETIRSKIGKTYVHKSPGSEWPHSYGIRGHRDGSFWSLAKRLDETSGRYSV